MFTITPVRVLFLPGFQRVLSLHDFHHFLRLPEKQQWAHSCGVGFNLDDRVTMVTGETRLFCILRFLYLFTVNTVEPIFSVFTLKQHKETERKDCQNARPASVPEVDHRIMSPLGGSDLLTLFPRRPRLPWRDITKMWSMVHTILLLVYCVAMHHTGSPLGPEQPCTP